MPSPTWRIWSSLAYYGFILNRLSGRHRPSPGMVGDRKEKVVSTIRRRGVSSILGSLYRVPLQPHGEFKNAVSEIYHFSKRQWIRLFQANGFRIVDAKPNGIFYTGWALHPEMPLSTRRKMSSILGSACNIFVVQDVNEA